MALRSITSCPSLQRPEISSSKFLQNSPQTALDLLKFAHELHLKHSVYSVSICRIKIYEDLTIASRSLQRALAVVYVRARQAPPSHASPNTTQPRRPFLSTSKTYLPPRPFASASIRRAQVFACAGSGLENGRVLDLITRFHRYLPWLPSFNAAFQKQLLPSSTLLRTCVHKSNYPRSAYPTASLHAGLPAFASNERQSLHRHDNAFT